VSAIIGELGAAAFVDFKKNQVIWLTKNISSGTVSVGIVNGTPRANISLKFPLMRGSKKMKGSKIVYIEDDKDLIDLVSMILKPHGYDVLGSTDGHEGLDLIRIQKPDLILLDLMIPDLSGWEIYKIISADPNTENIPVIIITAKSQPIDQVLGTHIAKVEGYICKPFMPSELIERVEQILAG
jgi:CheY-like chemotaxis protein